MISLELENTKGNSLSYNPANDDPTLLNYLALAYCIAMPEKEYEKINITKILGTLRTRENSLSGKHNKKIRDKIVVKNIETGKRKTFQNYKDAARYTNTSTTTIHSAVQRGRIVKDKWKFAIKKAGDSNEQ